MRGRPYEFGRPSSARSLLRRAALAAIAAALLLIGFVPSAGAIGEYSAAQTVSAPDDSIIAGPEIAVGPDDRATVVWSRYREGAIWVEAAQIDRDGGVGPVRTLAELSDGAWSPQIAVDRRGHATVVWYGRTGASFQISAVHLDADGVPGPVRSFGFDAMDPQVTVDSQGRATVVWFSGGGNTLNVQATRLDASGVPDEPRVLSRPGEGGFLPHVAVDSHDRVTAAWSGDEYVQTVRIDSDGALGPVRNLSRQTFSQGFPDIAIDTQDRVTVVWKEGLPTGESEGPNDVSRVKFARLSATGEPGPAQTLSGPGQALGPNVAIDSQDRAVVVWTDQSTWTIGSARIGADGGAGPFGVIAPVGFPSGPHVAADRSGGVTIVWNELFDDPFPHGAVKALHVGTDGRSSPPQLLSPDAAYYENARAVIDSRNRVVVAWKRSTGTSRRVQVAQGGKFEEPDKPKKPKKPKKPPPHAQAPDER